MGACDVVLVVHRSARTQPTCACSMRHAETAPCLDVGADVTLRGGSRHLENGAGNDRHHADEDERR